MEAAAPTGRCLPRPRRKNSPLPGPTKVEAVFLLPEGLRQIGGCPPAPVDRAEIAAGTEAALALARHHDRNYVQILLEAVECLLDLSHHTERQAVERLRAIEADVADGARPGHEDVRFAFVHRRTPFPRLSCGRRSS